MHSYYILLFKSLGTYNQDHMKHIRDSPKQFTIHKNNVEKKCLWPGRRKTEHDTARNIKYLLIGFFSFYVTINYHVITTRCSNLNNLLFHKLYWLDFNLPLFMAQYESDT